MDGSAQGLLRFGSVRGGSGELLPHNYAQTRNTSLGEAHQQQHPEDDRWSLRLYLSYERHE